MVPVGLSLLLLNRVSPQTPGRNEQVTTLVALLTGFLLIVPRLQAPSRAELAELEELDAGSTTAVAIDATANPDGVALRVDGGSGPAARR
jgi:hypothetical protein